MTEEEAKEKICHKTLAAMGGSDGVPSWTSPQPCLGSACMAWRWLYADEFGADANGLGDLRVKIDGGYCGLAGKP